MLLYIVRHAIAEERDPTLWPDDAQRPLTVRGKKRFKKFLKRMDNVKFKPTLIATSPFTRCHETAELLVGRLGNDAMLVPQRALEPGSDLNALVQWTAEQTATEIAWVGHAPDVSHLAAKLIGNGDTSIEFAKGAIAAIEFETAVQPGAGKLRWLATAKLLGA
jgi:phosphohistidine phosphatase